MAQKLIRDIPDEVMSALENRASADGMNAEAWIRAQLIRLAQDPIVRERYAYRVYSKSGSKGIIRRHSNHPNGVSVVFKEFGEEEAQAMDKAADYIRRNQPGDLPKALGLLNNVFEEVIEVPV